MTDYHVNVRDGVKVSDHVTRSKGHSRGVDEHTDVDDGVSSGE